MKKKNIVFYGHNFGGLGHTNRLFAIMKDFIKNFWHDYNVIFLQSGKNYAEIFYHPEIKTIHLPDYMFQDYFVKKNSFNDVIFQKRKKIFEKIFALWNIEKFIVEHFPFGRHGMQADFLMAIRLFRQYNSSGYIFSSVRDIFEFQNIFPTILQHFDRFLIHGDEKIVNYNKIFPQEMKHKIYYTGYVLNDFWDITYKNKPHIVISLGGWQDGFEFVCDFLKKCNLLQKCPKIYVALWWQYNSENILKIKEIFSWDIEIKDFFVDFSKLRQEAKMLVSMGGYNSMIESIKFWKTTLVYPRDSDFEQIMRLKVFSKKFYNILDARLLSHEQLQDILENNDWQAWISFVDINGSYKSASFIYNFWKYHYAKIRLTNRCNATCDMCWVIKRKINDNDLLILKKSIEDFYKIWWKIINFTGWEPTIYKWFWDLVYFAKTLWFVVSLSTNGSTLWENFWQKFSHNDQKNIDYMDISVDALNELQDSIRWVPGLFSKIENNIKEILNRNIYLHINVTIRNDNIFQMKEIFYFFQKIGVQSISFGMVASDPLNDTTALIPNIRQLYQFYCIDVPEIQKNKNSMKVNFSPAYSNEMTFEDFCSSIQNKNAFPKKKGKHCEFIRSKKEIRINEGWLVTPCCILDDYDEGIWNINTTRLINIICSKTYESFLHRTFPNISKACLQCKLEI